MDEKAVAFIDLMGFSELVISDLTKASKLVNYIEEFIAYFRISEKMLSGEIKRDDSKLEVDEYSYWATDCEGKLKPTGIQLTYFSDSLVVSCSKESVVELLELVRGFSAELLGRFGCLVRGGVVIGKLVHEKGVVVGEALLRAHYIESKVSCYPRVVVEANVIDALQSAYPESEDYFELCDDGLWVVRTLEHHEPKFVQLANQLTYDEWVSVVVEYLQEALTKNMSNPSIHKKVYWAACKFNEKINVFPYGHTLVVLTTDMDALIDKRLGLE